MIINLIDKCFLLKFIFISSLFIFSSQKVFSQNLVKNSSFEYKKKGKYRLNKSHELLLDWDYIHPNYIEGGGYHYKDSMLLMVTTYYDVREVKNLYKTLIVPKIPFSFVIPFEGNCFVQNASSYFKRFYQTKLKKPLIKDNYYYFEMYYRIESLSEEADKIPTGWVGSAFSFTDFSIESNRRKLMNGSIKTKPEIFISKLDSTSLDQWVKFYGVFKASDNYPFMLLGNHQVFDLKNRNPFNHPRDKYILNGRSSWVEALIFKLDNITLIPYSEAFRSKYMKEGSIYPIYNIALNDLDEINNSNMLDNLVQFLISKKNSCIEVFFPEEVSRNSMKVKILSDALESYFKVRGVGINRMKILNFDSISKSVKELLNKNEVSFYFNLINK